MKNYLLFFLLLAGTATGLHAQYQFNAYDAMFNSPPSAKSNGQFKFFYGGRQTIMIELTYASQLNYLPDLDSLLQHTIQILNPLKDSLKEDGIVRRVDMVFKGNIPAIRIVTHPEYANTYTIRDKELMQLKVNEDTVRLVIFTPRRIESTDQATAENATQKAIPLFPFVITIFANNVADIGNIPPNALSQCVATLRPKIERYTHWDKPNAPQVNYRAQFNMATGKMFTSMYTSYDPTTRGGFQPLIGFGLTAVRGAVAPLVEGGLEYVKSNGYYNNRFRLSFELQTFFSRDSAQKLHTFNNSFIDVGYTQRPFNEHDIRFVPNISVGYLFRRQGEWYEKNTFRLGLPQLAGRNFSVTPQLVFNDFFKNVSIGFRFCLNF
jgi:hypothetical protein